MWDGPTDSSASFMKGVPDKLAEELGCKSSGQGLSPGHDRVEDHFSVNPSQHLHRPINACLTFMCTPYTKIISRVYVHLSRREGLMAHGMETHSITRKSSMQMLHNSSTQMLHNSSRMIKTMIVATPDGKRGELATKQCSCVFEALPLVSLFSVSLQSLIP